MSNLKSWISAVCFMLILLVRQSISLALPMGQAVVEIVTWLKQDHVRRNPGLRGNLMSMSSVRDADYK